MAERNIKFWANWARAIDWLPNGVKEGFAWKIIEYALLDREPVIEACEMPVWEMIKTSVDADLKATENGAKGGRPRSAKTPQKTPSKTPQETQPTTHAETPSETLINESEAESEAEAEGEPPLPPLEDCDNEAAAFAVEALAVFNAITGQDVRDMPGDAWCGLRRVFDAGRTMDDVRSVVEKKHAEWNDNPRMAKFVRPSTLFGDKFDEYLNQRERTEGGDGVGDDYSAL